MLDVSEYLILCTGHQKCTKILGYTWIYYDVLGEGCREAFMRNYCGNNINA